MTPEQRLEEFRRRKRLEEFRRRKAQARPQDDDEVTATDTARGALGAANRGVFLGAADELAAAGRTALDLGSDVVSGRAFEALKTPGQQLQPIGERFRMYAEDERNVRDEFSERNPGAATALEITGAIASPVSAVRASRLPRALQGAGIAPRAARGALRGGAEGAAVGFAEGEGSLQDRAENAVSTARTGAMFGGGMSAAGGALGRTLSRRRVAKELGRGENFTPLNMADPSGNIGSFYRNYIGTAIGGRGALQRQESQAIRRNPRLARFGADVTDAVPAGRGAAGHVDDLKRAVGEEFDVQRATAATMTRRAARAAQDAGAESKRAARQAQSEADRALADVNEQVKRVRAEAPLTKSAQNDVIEAQMDAVRRQMRRRQAQAAVPEYADPEIRRAIANADDPGTTARLLDDFWQNRGFAGVKAARLAVDDELLKALKGKVPKKTLKKLRAAAEEGELVSGEDLMEARNVAARASGTAGDFRRGQLRQDVKEIDEQIRRLLRDAGDDDALARFDQDLSQYGDYQAYVKSVDRARARGDGSSLFTEQDLAKAAPKRQRRYGTARSQQVAAGASRQRKALERATRKQAEEAQAEVSRLEQARKRIQDQQKARTSGAVSAAERAREEAQRVRRVQEQRGRRLTQAKRAAQNRIERETENLTQQNATPFSQLASTFVLGLGEPVVGASFAATLSSPAFQRAIAGQTALQNALRRALESGDTAAVNSIITRVMAQQTAQ